jgi:hypothetical protein
MVSGIISGRTVALAALLTILVSASIQAQPQAGIDLAYKSKYIWRGIPFNNESVLWPDAWVGYKGFTATVWGSLEMTNSLGHRSRCTELDFYLDYTRSFGVIEASLGYSHFTYPHTTANQTGEAYMKAGVDLKYIQVGLGGYFDVIDVKGTYISLQISRDFTVGPIQTDLTGSVGFANARNNLYWFGVEKAGWMDFTTGLNLSYSLPGNLGQYLSLSGDIDYSRLLDNDLAAAYPDHRDNVWFGLGLAAAYPGASQ